MSGNVALNDVDEKVLRNEVNRGFSNKRIPFEYSGTIDVLKKFGLISASKSGFKFTFYRPLGQKYVQEMTKTEITVFNEIKKNNYIRVAEIAKIVGKSDKTVSRAKKN